MDFQKFLNYEILNNSGKNYLIFLAISLSIIFFIKILKFLIKRKFKKIATKTKNDVDDLIIELIEKIKPIFYFYSAFFLGTQVLKINEILDKILYALFLVLMVYQIIILLQHVFDYLIDKFLAKSEKNQAEEENTSKEDLIEDRENKRAIAKFIIRFVKWGLWIIGIILILSNLNVNVSSLITGLGIGGIAVALAVQNMLEDVFSSISIFTDKPFKIGDYVVLGTESGTVKRIGIKTTRITTLEGDELVVPNKELTATRIRNYKRMQKRRISFKIGVTYDTEFKKLKKIPQMIKDILKGIELTELDRVNFTEFADSSLNFEIVFYIDSANYSVAVKTKEKINYQILEKFRKEKIEFAYPTQTVFLEK
jgi:small-conductance mechanosensitive channel